MGIIVQAARPKVGDDLGRVVTRTGMRAWRLLFLVALGVSATLAACGTTAVGVDDCNAIEDALCKRAADMTCPGSYDLSQPLHPGGSAENAAACIRFYSIACLHGLVVTTAPNKLEVTTCVDAINGTDSCSVIEYPQTAPDDACAWLIPPEAGTDAEASTADAGDAGDAASTADASVAADVTVVADATAEATSDALAEATKDAGAEAE
jgi:hypothetical protein